MARSNIKYNIAESVVLKIFELSYILIPTLHSHIITPYNDQKSNELIPNRLPFIRAPLLLAKCFIMFIQYFKINIFIKMEVAG